MKFETCLACLRVPNIKAIMKRKQIPHISYKIQDNKIFYSTNEEKWFLFIGSLTGEDIMSNDWEIHNVLGKEKK